ncbi:hypothetical protein [Cellulosimicrobium marinum]|uniref:hypothetical protein n=1 Tax=Cellulosimicrobium marinum TaxID=1638992 RepID=UPI001E3AA99A|nr:hypothetical protein [Cellulosimicrobium marinum]MCB7136172.1 hypothetical protein [Cellulosimicrobium marinum]
MSTKAVQPGAMRPVDADAHRDVPEASRPTRGILGNSFWACFFWGAVVAAVAHLSATYSWAPLAFLVGAPVTAVVVGTAMTVRHTRRSRR